MAYKKSSNKKSGNKTTKKKISSKKKKTTNKMKPVEKSKIRKRNQVSWLIWTAIIMMMGLFFLKIVPMQMYGENILFDASAHVTITVFILYLLWFYVDQNKKWRIPYLIFSLVVLTLVSLQRIVVEKHDGTGLLLGFILSVISILIPRWNKLKNKFEF